MRRCAMPLFVLLIVICLTASPASAWEGKQVAPFTLKDFRGKLHSLQGFASKKAVVVYFMGTECPLAKLYGPRMQKIADGYADRGVAVVGVSSNVQDSITELAAYARIHGIRFPILKDLGNKVADDFGAKRTPSVFVLDGQRRIRYQGRVDAQFTFGSGVGLAKPKTKRNDLTAALDEVLAGKKVSVAQTEVRGCLIGRVRRPNEESKVTYSNQIARLLQRHCVECHRPGQIAPFSLLDYQEVAGWGEMIAEVVRDQRMPPWHADPKIGHFMNANLLTKEEKQLIYTWVDNGCPEGNRADLPKPKQYDSGWFLEDTDDVKVVRLPRPEKVKAVGVESYRYIEVDPKIKEDKWVELCECRPGNRSVVHHIIVFVKTKSAEGRNKLRFLAGFAPGTRPLVAPKGWARRIPAGAKLVFEMHYTPIGSPQVDQSSVALKFVDAKQVTHELVTVNAWNRDLEIEPFKSDQKVESEGPRFRRKAVLLSMFPHMHMRGKSFRYELIEPGKKPVTLLYVPKYDFNWQTSYILAKPRLIPRGSKIHCTAFFDNSDENLANPDPSKRITWGQQTWDEMMIGWYDIGVPIPKRR